MIDWKLPAARIDALLEAVGRAPGEGPDGRAETDSDRAFARTIWGVLVEPGDSVAGALLAGVGEVEAAQFLLDQPTPAELVRRAGGAIDSAAARAGLERWLPRRSSVDVERSIEAAARCGARLLIPGDADWPSAVDELDAHAPVLLWVRGDSSLLSRPGVAVVGARAASGYGEHVAMEFAAGLAQRDAVVVSGGAYGIDGMAHRAALAAGGATVAVLAGGVDRLYPSGHEALLTRIIEQGAVVSEAPCGSAPTRWRFLQRNRLIAALSAATVVVEAGRRSGSLNTANHAFQLGRPVGAVPGPVTSATSAGCHGLLRERPAECVTTVPEIMQLAFGDDRVLEDAPARGEAQPQREHPLLTRVSDALRPIRAQSVDELARAVGESPGRIRAALGELALEGRARADLDERWRGERVEKGSSSGDSIPP